MKTYEDNELIKQKALAHKIEEQVNLSSQKITKVCEKKAIEIETLEKNINELEDLLKISNYSKIIDEKRNELLQFVAVKNRMEVLANRNSKRYEYLSQILKNSGIYQDKVSKQDLDMMANQEIENISEDKINLNAKHKIKKYFDGELLTFIDGKLDLSLDENYLVLSNANEGILHKIIFEYPYCIETIGGSILTDIKLKKKILKEISAYVVEQSKTKNIKEINKSMGNILSFKSEMPENVESFVAGIKNVLNVKTCVYLAEKDKSKIGDIKKFKCNYKSELIPPEIKVALLANGLAGDIQNTEEQLSEDLKINEQKVIKNNAAMEGLKLAEVQKEENTLDEEDKKQEKIEIEQIKVKEMEKQEEKEEEFSNDEVEMLNQLLFGMKKEDD